MNQFTNPKVRLFPEPVSGKVEEAITQSKSGRIKFQGSYWPARLYQSNLHQSNLPAPISQGQEVTVVGIEGITLLVVPGQSQGLCA